MAGPSVLLGYALAGVVAFFIMRQLGDGARDRATQPVPRRRSRARIAHGPHRITFPSPALH
ncbi:hypothetical protein ACN4GN_31615, partial [Burkholderia pseudomallei]